MNKNVITIIPSLDKFMEGGIPAGKISFLMGETVPKTPFFFKAWPPVNEQRMIFFNLEDSEAITKHGMCVIDDMLKKMRENGIDVSNIPKNITRMEDIGGTMFPVTYHENGMITVDYPSRLIKDKKDDSKK